ncbi:MAG: hypothetical protein ACXABE_03655, partial [Candidatus Thorarchaeota archaeon]
PNNLLPFTVMYPNPPAPTELSRVTVADVDHCCHRVGFKPSGILVRFYSHTSDRVSRTSYPM